METTDTSGRGRIGQIDRDVLGRPGALLPVRGAGGPEGLGPEGPSGGGRVALADGGGPADGRPWRRAPPRARQQPGGVEGVRYAVLMSSGGLLEACRETISQEGGEKFAAPTAVMRAATRAWNEFTGGGGVHRQMIECLDYSGLTTAARQNTMLSVDATGPLANIGLISHHMAQSLNRGSKASARP
ncbi:roadblock/LC7 domain-containing protein [Streptomyces sp. NPDC002133]|uniref:roadblock/LC7 domain-containing protein n=1 Tax=Streptomyces sp. NPDC002133 TaxID=3154409 RepID=UPI003325B1C2